MQISIFKKGVVLSALITMSWYAISASTMRCGNKIVNIGDTTIDVKIICGKPFDSESLGIKKENNSYIEIERYTYLFGKGKLAKILEFEGGKLVNIQDGPRG